jgi:uncharacterized protein (TIGR02996 family)
MTDETALLFAVREDPEDDTPRLVLADWLEENGKHERAEFIRVQCQLARLPYPAPSLLKVRERALIERHGFAWVGPLHNRVADWGFSRGFTWIDLSPDPWKRPGRILGRDVLASLLQSPKVQEAWRWVDSLFVNAEDAELAEMARSASLTGITALHVGGGRVGPSGARSLAACPSLTHLANLDLTNSRIGPEGAQALAGSASLTALRRLHLRRNALGNEGARALAASPNLSRLVELNLNHNDIEESGARALLDSPHLPRGLWLHLHSNPCHGLADALAARFERVTWGN